MIITYGGDTKMLLGLMRGIGIFYYWTWFVWPFVFVFSLVDEISSRIKDEGKSPQSSIIAAISLLIILAGVVSPALY